jgi:hypothetical protein
MAELQRLLGPHPQQALTRMRMTAGGLVYRWTLKDGRTVPPGPLVFAGQYDHADGERDAGDDSYTVRATAQGETAERRGDFE